MRLFRSPGPDVVTLSDADRDDLGDLMSRAREAYVVRSCVLPGCGATFWTRSDARRYCSQAHRARAWRARAAAR